jgi:hypothetical protein
LSSEQSSNTNQTSSRRHLDRREQRASLQTFREDLKRHVRQLSRGSSELIEQVRSVLNQVELYFPGDIEYARVVHNVGAESKTWAISSLLRDFESDQGLSTYVRQGRHREVLRRIWESGRHLAEMTLSIEHGQRRVARDMVRDFPALQLELARSSRPSRSVPDKIPDLLAQEADWAQVRLNEEAFTAGSDASALVLWKLALVAGYCWILPMVPGTISRNRAWRKERNEALAKELETLIRGSILERRWPIIKGALRAQAEKDYSGAIPVLLSQVEGVFTDALVIKKLAIPVPGERGKYHARGTDGKVKCGKRGKPVELEGLHQKLDHSWYDDEHRKYVKELVFNRLIQERNAVLHGGWVEYGKPWLSVHALLVLCALAVLVIDFETSNVA